MIVGFGAAPQVRLGALQGLSLGQLGLAEMLVE
jgi:hypothetical protein